MKRSKPEGEDLSQPTEYDLSNPPEMKSLKYEGGKVEPVWPEPEPLPPPPAPVVPPPAERIVVGRVELKSPAIEAALALVEELCVLCQSGVTLQLADLRKLKAKISAL